MDAEAMEDPASLTAENERLRRELDAVQGERAAVRRRRNSRLRAALVGGLVVLTSVSVVLAAFTVWVHRTMLDSDRFVELVAPLGTDPTVTAAASSYIARTVITDLDLQSRTQEALPDRAAFLAAPITGAVQNFVEDKAHQVLSSPRFEQLWTDALRTAHSQIVGALRGQSTTLVIENEQVTLNLVPLIADVIRGVDQRAPGLIAKRIPDVPDVSGLPPDQARADLSTALGRELPADFGQVVVYEGSQVTTAQDIVRWLDRLPVITIALVLVLITATLLLSMRRRRTLVQLAVGVVVALVIARALIKRVEEDIGNAVQPGQARGAALTVTSRIGGSILDLTFWILVIGVVVAVAAFLAGKPEWFRWANRWFRTSMAAGRGFLVSDRPAVRWARDHADGLRLVGIIGAIVAIVVFGVSGIAFILIVAILAAYLAIVAFVARAARPGSTTPGSIDGGAAGVHG